MEIIQDLRTVSEQYPELRIGQILSLAAHRAGWMNEDLFYCPDDTLLEGLEAMKER